MSKRVKSVSALYGGRALSFDLSSNNSALFERLSMQLSLQMMLILKQTHGAAGQIITSKDQAQKIGVRQVEGDFLITNCSGIGIAVLTADCLPIIISDSQRQIVAIIHAGWRGAAAGIVSKVVNIFQEEFKSNLSDLQISFGPSAQACCYEVGSDFIEQFPDKHMAQKAVEIWDEKLFFDLPFFVMLQLELVGIANDQINKEQNMCTICNPQYCSYRRDAQTNQRNVTVVSLK